MIKNLFKAFFRKECPRKEVPIWQAPPPAPEMPHKLSGREAWLQENAARETAQQEAKRYRNQERDKVNACNDLEELRRHCRDHFGFTREAAIQRCAALHRPELLASVFERLNDWVPPVRDAARTAVLSLLPCVTNQEALALLPEVHHLENLKRSDHLAWIGQFERALVGKIPPALFIEGLERADVPLARSCYRVLRHHRLMDLGELIRRSFGRVDDIVLTRLAVQACAELPEDRQLPLYQAALRSHFGNVRTQALRALMELGDKESRCAAAIGFLWDMQASVRAVAVFHLRENGVDVRLRYLEAFADPAASTSRKRIALSELGNAGTSADIGLLRSFCASELPCTRLAALSAWFKLEPSARDDIARQALLDVSPRVRRLAVYLLTEQGAFLPADFMRETMAQHGETNLLPWMLPSGRL